MANILWGIADYIEHDPHDGNPVWATAWELHTHSGTRFLSNTPETALATMFSAFDIKTDIVEDIELPYRGSVDGMTARVIRLKWLDRQKWILVYPLPITE